jgi:hypothetical protein
VATKEKLVAMEINERTAGGNTPSYVVSGDGVISPIVQCMCESVVSGGRV